MNQLEIIKKRIIELELEAERLREAVGLTDNKSTIGKLYHTEQNLKLAKKYMEVMNGGKRLHS